ncbi:MAG: hypothetical protein KJ601_03595, partial [Nanoarchaeota archaeon]|nr:hypothetical protein [Nanoarchaeota archaeon]
MKKGIKILLIVTAIIVLLNVIGVLFKICPPKGPWTMPPWCEGLEVRKGAATETKFYVSIPYTAQVSEVYLNIDGKDPILMEKAGELGYQTVVDTVGQETVNYKYTGSFGESRQFSAKITGRDLFDGIAFESRLSSIFGVNMA